MTGRFAGPLLIAFAALLWGTDSLYRSPAVGELDPTFIVFAEHVLGLLALLPWILWKHRSDLLKLTFKEWLCAAFVGAGGGAVATVLFTASFRYLNPSVTILLQKLQPVFTVLLAFAFLGERPERKFYPWAAVALAAGLVLSFPDFNFHFLVEPDNVHAKGVIYALSAAGIWSFSTVAGRRLLLGVNSGIATFWRYSFGLAMLTFMLRMGGIGIPWSKMESGSIQVGLLYLSFATGLFPMLAYYAGLARTPAAVATFVELLYPVSAVALNTVFLNSPLSNLQLVASGMLLFAVSMISR